MGYLGPTSGTMDIPNHDSAARFPQHINGFLSTEMDAGALVGLFMTPPFTQWAHVSPLMSCQKGDMDKRRVITDLTFSPDRSVTAYIMKNSALGQVRDHSLPSVADLVTALKHADSTAHLFTVDIARAYTNFFSDPLDWPILCLQWGDVLLYANFVSGLLKKEGIEAIMYLEDVFVVAPDKATALVQYNRVHQLLLELGLP